MRGTVTLSLLFLLSFLFLKVGITGKRLHSLYERHTLLTHATRLKNELLLLMLQNESSEATHSKGRLEITGNLQTFERSETSILYHLNREEFQSANCPKPLEFLKPPAHNLTSTSIIALSTCTLSRLSPRNPFELFFANVSTKNITIEPEDTPYQLFVAGALTVSETLSINTSTGIMVAGDLHINRLVITNGEKLDLVSLTGQIKILSAQVGTGTLFLDSYRSEDTPSNFIKATTPSILELSDGWIRSFTLGPTTQSPQ